MVVLKHKFKLRFFIDESVSFGTLGDHGKGITEYAGLELNDIDLIMATLEYSAGSIGGFCVGTTYVVEHQGFVFFRSNLIWLIRFQSKCQTLVVFGIGTV